MISATLLSRRIWKRKITHGVEFSLHPEVGLAALASVLGNKSVDDLKSYIMVLILSFGYDLVSSGVALDKESWEERQKEIDKTLLDMQGRLAGIPSALVWGTDPRLLNMEEPEVTERRMSAVLDKGRAIGLNVVDAREWLRWTAKENWKGFTMVSSNPTFAVDWLSNGIKQELDIQALNAGRIRNSIEETAKDTREAKVIDALRQTTASATESATCRIINKFHNMNLARGSEQDNLGSDDACVRRETFVWTMVPVGHQQYRFYDPGGRALIPTKQVDKTRTGSVVIVNHELGEDTGIWNVVPFEGKRFYKISSCKLDGSLTASEPHQRAYLSMSAPPESGQDVWMIISGKR